MARKKIECGPPVELSNVYLSQYIGQKCHICEDCGQKTHWPGTQNPNGVYPIIINGRTLSIRRLAYQLNGGKLRKNWKIITTCPNHRCINTGLLRQVSMKHIVNEAHRMGKLMTPLIRSKISAAKRLSSGKITQEVAEQIKIDPRSSSVIAAENGISDSYVRALKSGIARRNYTAGPFAGLFS